MNVIGDLVARERRSDGLAVRADSRAGSYSYEKLCTTAWKAGNLLRHYGVRDGATVAVDAGESLSPPPLTAFLGAGLLGATVTFDPAADSDSQVIVAPADRIAEYEPRPGTQVVAYGGTVEDPAAAHFEREVWSENPTMPPEKVGPDSVHLTANGDDFTQNELLGTAERVATEYGLDPESLVAVRAPLSTPGAVAAGVLAPLTVGAGILVDTTQTGTVGVGQDGPESRLVDPATVF